MHLLKREKSRKIVDYIYEHNEGVTKNFLSKELQMHRNTLTKYLDKFEDSGLLIKKELSNKSLYYLDEDMYDSLKEM